MTHDEPPETPLEKVRYALLCIRTARAWLLDAGADSAASEVARAVKSVESAERHALHLEHEERESTMTPDLFSDLPKMPPRGISWERHPMICRANHQMLVDGKPNGIWVCAAQHPTALRPYYVVMPTGEMLERKFRLLDEAKAAAIAQWETLQ